MSEKLKINAGCGVHTIQGWKNYDRFPEVEGVEPFDFEMTYWPWEDNSVDEMLFNHSLEHMGQSPATFLQIMKNIYRICCDGAIIHINAPHHTHDEFWGDPTHVRPLSADGFVLFSKKANQAFRDAGGANSCFAFQLGVDFDVIENNLVLDDRFAYLKDDPSWQRMAATQRNVVREIRLKLRVNKSNG